MRLISAILLGAVPGLMGVVLILHGAETRFIWQLASIWLAGLAFTALLSSWWLRAFWLLALVRTATLPWSAEAFFLLLTLAVFLAAAEGCGRIEPGLVLTAIRLAGFCLIGWMLAQRLGLAGQYFPQPAGPFNPNGAGIFLALCLPAFFAGESVKRGQATFLRTKRCQSPFYFPFLRIHRLRPWHFIPFLVWGLVASGSTAAVLAAAAAAAVWACLAAGGRRLIAVLAVLAVLVMFWAWQASEIKRYAGETRAPEWGEVERIVRDPRWLAWKHALRATRVEPWGRGLGSFRDVFPLLVSGEPRLAQVEQYPGLLKMDRVWRQGHNEYVQTAFELGWPALALMAAFLIAAAVRIFRGAAAPMPAAGLAALALGCFGFFTMHVSPLALVGCAWIGMWEGRRRSFRQDLPLGCDFDELDSTDFDELSRVELVEVSRVELGAERQDEQDIGAHCMRPEKAKR